MSRRHRLLLAAHADDPIAIPVVDGVINAKTAGAKGDQKSDDTDALQRALDMVSDGRAACLYLPIGVYRTTRPLVLRGSMTAPTVIRGEATSVAGGSSIIFDGPAASPCVLEVAGGIGVAVERIYVDCRSKAIYGLYLHDRLPDAIMTDVVLRDLSVTSPLPGDSPDLPKGAKSAAISLGVHPDGTPLQTQCDHIKLVDLTLSSTQDAHAAHYGVTTGIFNVKNFFIDRLWMQGFKVGIYIPTGGGTCTVTGGTSLGCTESDFKLGSGILAVTGWESENSAKLLNTPGFHASYASASFERCGWYGSQGDGIAIFFGGNLSLRGCDFQTGFTPADFPKIALIEPQQGSATSVDSQQNFFRNAKADSPIFCNWNASAPIPRPDGCPKWLRSWGDLGGTGGALVPLPALNGPTPATPPPVVPPRVRTVTTVTIPRGARSTTVEHNLGGQPALEDVAIVPDGPQPIWVSSVTATTVTVQINPAAPAAGRKFTLSASRQP